MLTRLNKAPFPFMGGKAQASPLIWSLLGDPHHYVEAFCGTMAVLSRTPPPVQPPVSFRNGVGHGWLIGQRLAQHPMAPRGDG